MTIGSLPRWADELAAAFKETGPDVAERSIFGGRAFLVEGALIGTIELKVGQLAVRLRLDERSIAQLRARAHFDPESAVPTLLIVTDDDRDFAISLIPQAYRFARSKRVEPVPPAPATVAPGPAPAPRRRRPTR